MGATYYLLLHKIINYKYLWNYKHINYHQPHDLVMFSLKKKNYLTHRGLFVAFLVGGDFLTHLFYVLMYIIGVGVAATQRFPRSVQFRPQVLQKSIIAIDFRLQLCIPLTEFQYFIFLIDILRKLLREL